MSKVVGQEALERLIYHIKRLFIKKSDISITTETYDREHESATVTIGSTDTIVNSPVFQRDVSQLDDTANDYIKNASCRKEYLAEGTGEITTAKQIVINVTTTSAIEFGKDTIDLTVSHNNHSHKYAWSYIISSSFYMADDKIKVTVTGSGTSYIIELECFDTDFEWPVGETYTYDIIRPHQIDSYLTDKGWVFNEKEGTECVKIWWKDKWESMIYCNNDYITDLRSTTDSKIDVLPQHFYLLPSSASNINISRYDYSAGETNGVLVELTERSNTWRFIVTKTENVQLYITPDSELSIDWMQSVSKMEDGKSYLVEIVGNTQHGMFGNYFKME